MAAASVPHEKPPCQPTAARGTAEVLEAHLALRCRGEVARDIAENYSDDVVLLTDEGVYRGHGGIEEASKVLSRYVPDGDYTYSKKHVADEYAYLEWRGESCTGEPCYGWDAFVIRGGRIVAQMVYFSCQLRPRIG